MIFEPGAVSAEKIEAMCNFVFMTEGDKEQFDFSDQAIFGKFDLFCRFLKGGCPADVG